MLPQNNLETTRLTIRRLTSADAVSLFEIFGDAEVMRYWSSPPFRDLEESEHHLGEILEAYEDGTSMRLGVERKDDGGMIGTLSLHSFNAQCRRAEIGYALARAHWGKGYMHEALCRLLDYCFSDLRLRRLEADIDPRNVASARVLHRLGFRQEGLLRERWIVGEEVSDTAIFGLLADEWTGQRRSLSSTNSPADSQPRI